jgi:hypothetical protein
MATRTTLPKRRVEPFGRSHFTTVDPDRDPLLSRRISHNGAKELAGRHARTLRHLASPARDQLIVGVLLLPIALGGQSCSIERRLHPRDR